MRLPPVGRKLPAPACARAVTSESSSPLRECPCLPPFARCRRHVTHIVSGRNGEKSLSLSRGAGRALTSPSLSRLDLAFAPTGLRKLVWLPVSGPRARMAPLRKWTFFFLRICGNGLDLPARETERKAGNGENRRTNPTRKSRGLERNGENRRTARGRPCRILLLSVVAPDFEQIRYLRLKQIVHLPNLTRSVECRHKLWT